MLSFNGNFLIKLIFLVFLFSKFSFQLDIVNVYSQQLIVPQLRQMLAENLSFMKFRNFLVFNDEIFTLLVFKK